MPPFLAWLNNLSYRDGFWLLFGAVLGCHLIGAIDHMVENLIG